jgi:hypothetical protein
MWPPFLLPLPGTGLLGQHVATFLPPPARNWSVRSTCGHFLPSHAMIWYVRSTCGHLPSSPCHELVCYFNMWPPSFLPLPGTGLLGQQVATFPLPPPARNWSVRSTCGHLLPSCPCQALVCRLTCGHLLPSCPCQALVC